MFALTYLMFFGFSGATDTGDVALLNVHLFRNRKIRREATNVKCYVVTCHMLISVATRPPAIDIVSVAIRRTRRDVETI